MKRVSATLDECLARGLRTVQGRFRGMGLGRSKRRRTVAISTLSALALAVTVAFGIPFSGTQSASAQDAGICDRTEQVQAEILDRLSDVSDCASVTHEDLTRITIVSLWGDGVASLREGDFDGLSNLRKLYLAQNLIETLPDDIFESLSSLQELYLDSNQLRVLPARLFDGLFRLQKLDLAFNHLNALPKGTFDDLSNLQELNLAYNQLSTLPVGVFDPLDSLTELDLSHNQLSALPDAAFDHFSNLADLNLAYNRLSALPDAAFDHLSSLADLNLAYNRLSALPDGGFNGLSSLVELNFAYNRLIALPDGAFDGLSNLQGLDLGNNHLNGLSNGVFHDLSNLQRLWLHGNRLSVIPDGIFYGLSSLQRMWLGGNPGGPFVLSIELEQTAPDTFVAKVAEGAPFDMTTSLSVKGGSLPPGVDSVTVPLGKTRSEPIAVATATGSNSPTEVRLGKAPSQPEHLQGLRIEIAGEVVPPIETAPSPGDLMWRYKVGKGLYWLPPVAKGILYSEGSIDGETYIHALDASTSNLIWLSPLESNQPIIQDDLLFAVAGEDYRSDFYALNSSTGEILWSNQVDDDYTGLAVADGMAFITDLPESGRNYSYTALEALTGEMLWQYSISDYPAFVPVVGDGIIYGGLRDGMLFALDEYSGDLLWTYRVRTPDSSGHWTRQQPPLLSNQTLHIPDDDGHLHSLDASTGEVKWRYFTNHDDIFPIAQAGKVYVAERLASENGDAYIALDSSSGEVLWRHVIDGEVEFPGVKSAGTFYIGSADHVYAIDINSGHRLWKYEIEDATAPVIMEGVVYIGSRGYIYALETTNGKLLWRYDVDATIYSSLVLDGTFVYARTNDGYVYAIHTGTVEGTREPEEPPATPTPPASEHVQGICDRTEQVQERILGILQWFDVHNCAEVTDDKLRQIQENLWIQYEGLTALQKGDFKGLSELKILLLNGNELATLPEGVFDDLSDLEYLDISGNQLTELPDGVFDGLSNLKGWS